MVTPVLQRGINGLIKVCEQRGINELINVCEKRLITTTAITALLSN